VLRVTADPVFGEAFVTGLVVEYARCWPEVQLDVVLTRRRVDMVEEGFDVAFRVGKVDEPGLTATRLGPARVRYCASAAYLARRGTPRRPEELREHECILVVSDGAPVRWPFLDAKGESLLPVSGRLRLNSFAMAREAALGGLGIAIFPEFACVEDLRRKRLVAVLDEYAAEAGSVWLLHPAQRYLAARVRTFVELALERLGKTPPGVAGGRAERHGSARIATRPSRAAPRPFRRSASAPRRIP
jgi:DNA-binding transcriptional LysR family regulator